ncbi:alpha/beta hydrolase [Sedimentitalea sp. JM2-8]|uniref:Alpha/beta hydrolase n=1 Tax=Sedimentitalea xiamensis TaxID=3050037 RepID=A0ABT7FJ83_9RHOB|nr:alpha/beta hydrolase [Sedimentitalea xiamensis]MDK3075197.1 alpha/beta hydrolase [Sedimentitalea xiamensis]
MELDDAYANAAHIAGAEAFPSRWAAEARAFRERLGPRAACGIAYGAGERQVYDLFQPEQDPSGTVIFIHGGYWLDFDRSFWSHLAGGPLARGWAVAMPSYDLCPQVPIAGITRQIAQAVQHVAARTKGPISITGHSAGGHLAARMLDAGLISMDVARRLAAVVPISPISDLRPLMRTSMNADLGLDDAAARAESPIFMRDRHKASVAVWVGAEERPVFLDQARWLADAWGAELVVVPERHHFDVIDALSDPDSRLIGRLTGLP